VAYPDLAAGCNATRPGLQIRTLQSQTKWMWHRFCQKVFVWVLYFTFWLPTAVDRVVLIFQNMKVVTSQRQRRTTVWYTSYLRTCVIQSLNNAHITTVQLFKHKVHENKT